MAYSPSPRPDYSGPTHIPYADVTRHLWGDTEAGNVSDWIYVSTAKIHQLVFGLAPGGAFRHSEEFRTIFGADLIYYVLSGRMVIANPQTGEVHQVAPGEAAFFRKDTWHHVFNYSAEPLRILEYFAPPPSTGTSGAYARKQPYLADVRYQNPAHVGQWPVEQRRVEQEFTIRVLRAADLLWTLKPGAPLPTPVGQFVSTEHLTAAKMELLPGQRTELESHSGDECLYVLDGTVNIFCPDAEGRQWFELSPRDGFFVPAGAQHAYHNISGTPATLIFGVAPTE